MEWRDRMLLRSLDRKALEARITTEHSLLSKRRLKGWKKMMKMKMMRMMKKMKKTKKSRKKKGEDGEKRERA